MTQNFENGSDLPPKSAVKGIESEIINLELKVVDAQSIVEHATEDDKRAARREALLAELALRKSLSRVRAHDMIIATRLAEQRRDGR